MFLFMSVWHISLNKVRDKDCVSGWALQWCTIRDWILFSMRHG